MKLSKKGEKRTVTVVPMNEGVRIREREVFAFGGKIDGAVFLTRDEVRKLADYVQSLPALEK